MDYSLTLQIVSAIVAIMWSYFMIKSKVSQHDDKFIEIDKLYKLEFERLDKKIDKCFAKYDGAYDELATINQELSKKADLKEVASDYVTRKELELTLQKIELVTTSTNKEVAKIDKQMEEVIHLLQELRMKGH